MPPTSDTAPLRIEIRPETARDHRRVYEIQERAFGRRDEADLVDALREEVEPFISLVAEVEGRVEGHILFGPVTVDAGADSFEAIALAPLGVDPETQNRGIGSELVRRGLDRCRRDGHRLVFVLGHSRYYPRFGFRPAAPLGLRYEKPAPEEAFMVAEIEPGALRGRSGIVRYPEPFSRF
jgi:putative acetyltransferase